MLSVEAVQAGMLALLCGSFVGFTLGLIGGGGSILATPLLLYVVGVAQPHVAIGTGAVAVSVNAFLNFAGHARAGNVRWVAGAIFAPCGMAGALIGATLGRAVDGQRLLLGFAVLMIVVGVLMLRPRRAAACVPVAMTWRCAAKIAAVGTGVGLLAGFFGIGGGFLIVPGLIFATGMPLINAIGTSLLAVGTVGLATSLTYAVAGDVDWAVAAEYVAGGIGGGLVGMRCALRLAEQRQTLNRMFAALVFAVATYMVWRILRTG